MSQLDELIAEFCPNGVEYKTIDEIAVDIYRGSGIKRDQVTEEGIPCVRYGEIYTTYGVWFEECKSHTKLEYVKSPKYFEHGDILFAITGESVEDIAKCCAYIGNEKCLAGGDIVVLKHKEDPKYISYALSTVDAQRQKSSGKVKSKVVHSSVPSIKAIKLPVPPLEVQREIVHILDSFTLLTAELTAELTARKKQYNFYRDTLIQKGCKSEKVKLNTICEIYDGTHQTPKYTNSGIPFVSVENIDDLYGTQKFISPEAYEKYKIKPRTGDVFMTRITAGIIGKCTVVDRDDDLAYYVSLALLRPNTEVVDSKYLKYYLESGWGRRELSKWILWDATPTKINKDDIGRVLISVPPLDTQKRLVQVIEHFDAICTDLNIGLPAEIEARQKQYEYYRDLLLTFAETGSTLMTDRAERN